MHAAPHGRFHVSVAPRAAHQRKGGANDAACTGAGAAERDGLVGDAVLDGAAQAGVVPHAHVVPLVAAGHKNALGAQDALLDLVRLGAARLVRDQRRHRRHAAKVVDVVIVPVRPRRPACETKERGKREEEKEGTRDEERRRGGAPQRSACAFFRVSFHDDDDSNPGRMSRAPDHDDVAAVRVAVEPAESRVDVGGSAHEHVPRRRLRRRVLIARAAIPAHPSPR